MLIQPPGVEGVPGVEFGNHAHVHEPVVLQRLPEGFRRPGRHLAADARHLEQFTAALRVFFPGGHLVQPIGVAMGVPDEGVGGDGHGAQFLALVQGLGVVEKIQPVDGLLDLGPQVLEPLAVDLVAHGGVPRRALLLELGEDAGGIGRLPVVVHAGEDLLADRLSLPEGDDLFPVDPPGFPAYAVGRAGPAVQHFKVLFGVQTHFRVGRCGLGRRSALAHDQFARVDADVFVFQDVGQGQGPLDRHRFFLGDAAFVKRGDQKRPFGGNRGYGVETLPAQSGDAFVHDQPPMVTSNPLSVRKERISLMVSGEMSGTPAMALAMPRRRYLSSPMR